MPDHDRPRRRRLGRKALQPAPTTFSIPSTSLIGSIRPSSNANSARSSPSFAAYSPGARLISAATRESRSRAPGSRVEKTVIAAISSAVTMDGTIAGGGPPTP
jgi:hypothetical protein